MNKMVCLSQDMTSAQQKHVLMTMQSQLLQQVGQLQRQKNRALRQNFLHHRSISHLELDRNNAIGLDRGKGL